MKKRLGIFGGTFNPIHLGHLIVARETMENLKLDKIIFILSNIPPHKNSNEIASSKDRLTMLELAIKGYKNFTYSTIELERDGKSYTVETLKELHEKFNDTDLFFIIGADNLKDIKHWKDPKGILDLSNIIVLGRPNYEKYFENPQKYFPFISEDEFNKKVKIINVSKIAISSTDIRQRIHENRKINYLVPEKVNAYILKNKLYPKESLC